MRVCCSHFGKRAKFAYLDSLITVISSSPRAFPIIWGRRNGIEFHSYTLFCPERPTSLTPHYPHLIFVLLIITVVLYAELKKKNVFNGASFQPNSCCSSDLGLSCLNVRLIPLIKTRD